MQVYVITNLINEKKYVGSTTRTLKIRFAQHCNTKKNRRMPIVQAIRKHGRNNFKIETLETCSSIEELIEKEKFWIKELDTLKKGYNATEGGFGLSGYHHIRMMQKEGFPKHIEEKRIIILENIGL